MVAVSALAAACGSTPPTPASVPAEPAGRGVRASVSDRPPIDAIAALAPDDTAKVAWLAPGKIQLELGASVIEGPGPAQPLRVRIIDAHGGQVRLAVDLGYARFSVWSERTRLYALLARELQLAPMNAIRSDVHVTLRPGARVVRLAHDDKAKRTQVRYIGAVEAEGWVAHDVLVETSEPRPPTGRIRSRHKVLMVMQGAVIRTEAKWAATQLAVMAHNDFLDSWSELDDGWNEVSYADHEVTLRGFVSTRLPPGTTHRKRIDPETAPIEITPNAKVAGGTCLYVRAGGEAVGYIVGEEDADLDDAGRGWWNLAIDTPWGALTFAARGASKTELATCGPSGP